MTKYRIAEYKGKFLVQRKKGWWGAWRTYEHAGHKWDRWSIKTIVTRWPALSCYSTKDNAANAIKHLLEEEGDNIKYYYVDIREGHEQI